MSNAPASANTPATTRQLFRSSAMVSIMTQISRVLGMVRDIVLANAIGAGHTPGADAFFLAFTPPDACLNPETPIATLFGLEGFDPAMTPQRYVAEVCRYWVSGDPKGIDHTSDPHLLCPFSITTIWGSKSRPAPLVYAEIGLVEDDGAERGQLLGADGKAGPDAAFCFAGMLNLQFGMPWFYSGCHMPERFSDIGQFSQATFCESADAALHEALQRHQVVFAS